MTSERRDTYQFLTDKILASLESCGDWERPWALLGGTSMPRNEVTGSTYRGTNIIMCWLSAQESGYTQQRWATFQQWRSKGAMVRKGEKGTPIVFFSRLEREHESDSGETTVQTIPYARLSFLFNIDQVDGYTPPEAEQADSIEPADRIEPAERADQVIAASGAIIRHGGDRACYIPSIDEIRMPERSMFSGTETSTATESYYSTLLHELTHWTGPRLQREFGKRFGDDAYAAEELVAELGAAFLCAELGIAPVPRVDHAAYLKQWLKVLRNDKRAFFTAASAASAAAEFILGGAEQAQAAA